MARIRSDILYKRKIKEIEEGQKQARRLHIASPILNNQENVSSEDDSSEEEDESICEEDLNVSDLDDDNLEDDDSDEEETNDDFHWSEICTNWINLVDRENQFDNEEDNHLLEMTHNFLAAGRN